MNKLFLWPMAALSAAVALPAMACPDCKGQPASAQPVLETTADALSVVRDAETGRLRAPTPEEAAAAQQRSQARRVAAESVRIGGRSTDPSTPLLRSHASGARSVRLTADFSSYSVVVRQPDGSLAQRCVEGADAAARVMQSAHTASPAVAKAALATE